MKKFSEIELWKDVSPEEWKNWKWQLSHCINTLEGGTLGVRPHEEEMIFF